MTFSFKEQQEIYDSLSPKAKAHLDFVASLKELDRSGMLVSTLNPHSYDVEVLPAYAQTRQRRWFFFHKMVTTTTYMWVYRKKDKHGFTVDSQIGFADTEDAARHDGYKLVQQDAAAFTMAKIKEINEMPE